MGRGERPLDPEAGAVEKFAYELRQLRQQSGAPTYRTLAQWTHYSVTALSQAAAGRTLPSLAVLRAFVQACNGDVEAWERRWRETACAATPAGAARDDAVCDVKPKLSASQGVEPEPTPDTQSRPLETSAQPPSQRGWRHLRRRRRAVVLAAVIVGVAAVTAGMLWPATPSLGRGVGAVDPIADGSDPNRAGCGPGAVTLANAKVHFPASQLSGEVELRYSPRCHAAWGRFEPASGWNPGPGTMVTVWTIRPADQATQSYTVEFGGEAIIGNMLMTARGCVAAEVSMTRGQAASPVTTTVCLTVN